MIISHKHKYIFLKTHKTGGTSLQIALSRHCGAQDIISNLHEDDVQDLTKAGGLDQQNAEVPLSRYNNRDWFQYLLRGRKQFFTEHLAAKDIKRRVSHDIWDSYYKFCFERNPFDKVLSYFYWRTRNQEISLDQFLDEELDGLSDFDVYGINNEVCVNNVFLYENLNSSLEILEKRFQFNIDISKIKAKSFYRPRKQSYEEVLTTTQKNRIRNIFKREIDLFYPDLIK